MRKRKDPEWGRDTPPATNWAAFRAELHACVVDSLTERRLRDGIAPKEEAGPAG